MLLNARQLKAGNHGELLVLAMEDVTERRRAEEEVAKAKETAEAANRTKSLFLANMSHELRTPLNAILGYSEMLQEEAADQGVQDFLPDLQKIHGAGKHLLSLINDILDLSKIEAGKMELYLETFSVPKLIEEVVETIRPLVKANANTLRVHCPADLGTMHADMTKMRQSLFNLLSNAAKFTKEGAISLEVSREIMEDREWIWFRVSDTGIGMTAGAVGKAVPDVQPGGYLHHAQVRRIGPGSGPDAPLLPVDGRRCDRQQRAGREQHIHDQSARRRQRTGTHSHRSRRVPLLSVSPRCYRAGRAREH